MKINNQEEMLHAMVDIVEYLHKQSGQTEAGVKVVIEDGIVMEFSYEMNLEKIREASNEEDD